MAELITGATSKLVAGVSEFEGKQLFRISKLFRKDTREGKPSEWGFTRQGITLPQTQASLTFLKEAYKELKQVVEAKGNDSN